MGVLELDCWSSDPSPAIYLLCVLDKSLTLFVPHLQTEDNENIYLIGLL